MKPNLKKLGGTISVLAIVLNLAMCILAWGHTSPGEGVPWYGFGAGWMDPPRPGHPGQFRVSFVSGYYDSGQAVVRLHVPAGVELVSGDTMRIGNPGGEGMRWDVRIRYDLAEPRYITGAMSYDRGRLGIEEAEFDLPCSAVPESLGNQNSRTARAEVIRNGQRYRYGGLYLIPIDSSERIVEKEIRSFGSSAHVLASSAGITIPVLPTVQVAVNCVVFVRPDGSVRTSRVLDPREIYAGLGALIDAELRTHWKFAPGMLRGKPVDDWVEVRVPVRGE